MMKSQWRRGWWVAAAAMIVMVGAEPAQAGRKLVRRTLPGGQRASAANPAPPPADPAVQAGVDRLLATAAPAAPGVQRGGSNEAYLARTSSGHVKALVASPGSPWKVSRPGSDLSPEGLALSFLREHRVAFGWSKRNMSLEAAVARHAAGRSYVRLAQRFAGLPVFGAGVVVQVEGSGGVSYVVADIARDDAYLHDPGFRTEPAVTEGGAASTARGVVPASRQGGIDTEQPVLVVYEPSVIGNAGPSRLVWNVRVRSAEGDVNEVVLVDAITGDVAFHYSDVKEAKSRSIYDHNNNPVSTGTLVRSEGGAASGIVDADLAYQYLGDTYDFYFTRFGRDSFDGTGGTMIGRVRYCEATGTCPYPNAYWSGTEMLFGAGYPAADDVVAHELTHAVTERESNLIYWGESGAMNEALSDIFGEFVDLTNSGGTDTVAVRWKIGEDLPGGALRSMSDPTLFGDPDRRFSANWYTGGEDNRGVHFNCGIGNKLAYLLTDGGSFNGQTVAGQGITAVARLFYEANVNLLVPASDYFDLYAVLRQAARNLSWTPAAREALERACRAVQIDLPSNPTTVFSDGFEGSFPGSWLVIDQGGTGSGIGTQWGRSTFRKASGTASAYCAAGGTSPSPAGGPYKSLQDTWMVYGPFSLANTSNAWVDFDLFMDVEYPFDEAFWGVSTDGINFDGYAVSPGPDGYSVGVSTVPGWSHEVFSAREFTGVVGQNQVWIAFQFVSDNVTEYEGVYVDNVAIHKSPTQAPVGSFDSPTTGSTGITGAIPVTGWAVDDTEVTKLEIYRDALTGEAVAPNGKVYIGDATFVPGARPDVDNAYPTYPFSYKAGWGYMLLTNFLAGGNGTFTLWSYAKDGDGQTTTLGSKVITVTNATATKPFGTIDTPGQGGTVSGSFVNFGWALTPQPAAIPTDGSTITVYVDGAPLSGHPTYNQFRSDIASLFPGYANTNGAIGFYTIDTTTLTNGIHTISWLVIDNQARSDGIGSRYFWVQN